MGGGEICLRRITLRPRDDRAADVIGTTALAIGPCLLSIIHRQFPAAVENFDANARIEARTPPRVDD